MYLIAIFALITASSASAAAVAQFTEGVHCGTTLDATLSDCQALVNDLSIWEKAAWTTEEPCAYGGFFHTAIGNQMACHGECCVYAAGRASGSDYDKYNTREEAQALLGCGSPELNKINGLQMYEDHGICFSTSKGCHDCFDDNDFARRALRKRKMIHIGREVE